MSLVSKWRLIVSGFGHPALILQLSPEIHDDARAVDSAGFHEV